MSFRCLIVDQIHDVIISILEQKGIEVEYEPQYQRAEIQANLKDFDVLVIRSKILVDKELLSNSGKLKIVARAGAGIDNLDAPLLESKGIIILNAPEGNRDAVAEHAMGMILALINNFKRANKQIAVRSWNREQNRGLELGSMTVGIIGYGNAGQQLAKRLSLFGCRVIAYDKYDHKSTDEYADVVPMEEIFEHSDILSLHIPLTEETQGLLDDTYFDNFKKPIYLLNTSRGEIVIMKSLVEALKKKQVLGAGLDVLESEKMEDMTESVSRAFDYLSCQDNVIITPHVAGWTHESYRKISDVLANKIIFELFK